MKNICLTYANIARKINHRKRLLRFMSERVHSRLSCCSLQQDNRLNAWTDCNQLFFYLFIPSF